MGVHGLWELLSPIGERIPNSHVRNKRIAVDASIWLTQFIRAMRDAEGAQVANAHLIGVFRRCCKLLFLNVKPILVFDGATPPLKRKTREIRRAQHDRDVAKLRRLAERLLMNQMRQAAASAVSDAVRKRGLTGQSNWRKTKRPRLTTPPTEPIRPEFENDEDSVDLDPTISVELPDDVHQIDDEALVNLPSNVQAAIFKQIRQAQRKQHRQQVMSRRTDPESFSKAQIAGFMKNTTLNRRIRTVRNAINDRSGANQRIASDSSRAFLLEEGDHVDEEEEVVEDNNLDFDDSDCETPKIRTQLSMTREDQQLDLLSRIRIRRELGSKKYMVGGTINREKVRSRDAGLGWATKVLDGRGTHVLGGSEGEFASNQDSPLLNDGSDSDSSDEWEVPVHTIPDAANLNVRISSEKGEKEYLGLNCVDKGFVLKGEKKGTSGQPAKSNEEGHLTCGAGYAKQNSRSGRETTVSNSEKMSAGSQKLCQQEREVEQGAIPRSNNETHIVAEQSQIAQDVDDVELQSLPLRNEGAPASTIDKADGTPENTPSSESRSPKTDFDESKLPISEDDAPSSKDIIPEPVAIDIEKGMPIWKGTQAENHTKVSIGTEEIDSPEVTNTNVVWNKDVRPGTVEVKSSFASRGLANHSPIANPTTSDRASSAVVTASQSIRNSVGSSETASEIQPQVHPEYVERLRDNLEREQQELQKQHNDQQRVIGSVSDEMIAETCELLHLFGIPFLQAPFEAEAQCAQLEKAGLVDGVITEDSDVFLFGAKTVYRRLFADGKFAEEYSALRVERELGVNRNKLIQLAYLLGSDYTSGVRGIGIVNAMEVLQAFPGCDGLNEFFDWTKTVTMFAEKPEEDESSVKNQAAVRRAFCWKHRVMKRNWVFRADFPDPKVKTEYLNPPVNRSTKSFEWKPVNFDGLEQFCWRKLGWDMKKFNEAVGPLRSELEQRTKRSTQRTINEFFKPHRFAKIKSVRLKSAVTGMAGEDNSRHIMAESMPLGIGTAALSRNDQDGGEDELDSLFLQIDEESLIPERRNGKRTQREELERLGRDALRG